METAEALTDAPLQPPDSLLARQTKASMRAGIRPTDTHRPRAVATAVLLVALPALLVAPLAFAALRGTRSHSSVAWALALNLLWLVVFLPRDTWVDITAAARLSDGIVLAAVLRIPLWTRQRRTWLLVLGMIWCLLTPLLLFSRAYLGRV